jgi:hypothetical protein
MRTLKSAALIVIGSSLICISLMPITSAHERVDIRGIVTQIRRSDGQPKILGHILIEGTKESDTQFDKARVAVTTETTLFVERDGERKRATFTDLKEGQRVEASFIGPVMETYPVQAAAGEITLLSTAQDKVLLKKTWSGKDIPNEVRNALPPDSYVADNASWTKLWQALRGSEPLPQIDFAEELIVLCTTVSPNSCGVGLSVDEQGDLKILSMSTLIGSDAKTFNYQIASIDRDRIKSIAGKPVAAGENMGKQQSESTPCTAPEYRQFDFWLGDWDTYEVNSPDKIVARNRVTRILGGCALLEVYEQRDGLNGQSFTIYDAARKVWHQSWVTNRGQLLIIEGGLQGDRMVLTGIDRGADGKSRLIRGIWTGVTGGVRETAETSSDDGKTWKPFFDIVFRPHKP